MEGQEAVWRQCEAGSAPQPGPAGALPPEGVLPGSLPSASLQPQALFQSPNPSMVPVSRGLFSLLLLLTSLLDDAG